MRYYISDQHFFHRSGEIGGGSQINREKGTAIVGGVNVHKKAMRRTEKTAGGLIDKELPIRLCKLMPYDAEKKAGVRVRTGEKDGKKARISVKSGKAL